MILQKRSSITILGNRPDFTKIPNIVLNFVFTLRSYALLVSCCGWSTKDVCINDHQCKPDRGIKSGVLFFSWKVCAWSRVIASTEGETGKTYTNFVSQRNKKNNRWNETPSTPTMEQLVIGGNLLLATYLLQTSHKKGFIPQSAAQKHQASVPKTVLVNTCLPEILNKDVKTATRSLCKS